MASSINAVTSATATEQSAATQNKTDQAVNKEMFLKLLVAQIRHQDPLNPADGVQFLTQLAEFSGLEQMIAIREELEGIRGTIDTNAAAVEEAGNTQAPSTEA